MSPINVVVNGALGKMGQQVLSAVSSEDDMRAVAGVDHVADDSTVSTPDGAVSVPLSSSLADVLDGVDVVVDFTNAEGASGVIRDAAPAKSTSSLGPPASRTPRSRRQTRSPANTASASSSPPTSRWARS